MTGTTKQGALPDEIVFLDCEMTGGDHERNDIIEIGAVRTRLSDLTVVGDLSLKVAPRTVRGANPSSLRIAGYSPKGWKDAVAIDQALVRLREFVAGSTFVGWATCNDLLFVHAAAARSGIDNLVGDSYIEVQDWAQHRLHFPRSPGLQRVADQLKIVRDEEHSAIEDALVTHEVFRMLWRYGQEELDTVAPTLDWNSYADLIGPIVLEPEKAEARREEAAKYVLAGTSPEELLVRRGGYRR